MMTRDWHLDKTVSLGIILTVLLQGGALVWFTSQQYARIASLERTQMQHADWLQSQRDQIDAINERTIRMEEQLDGVRVVVNSIENYIRQRGVDAITGGR
jgi:uncharacterized protein involved in cysteine biosynthesis